VARPRYPSDDRKLRQRPHVKIHLSTRSHLRYGHVFDDPASRGIVWGLWLLAVQYHAPQTSDEVTLGTGDLVWLTGRTHRASALSALRVLCECMGYAMRIDCNRVVVKIRNLSRKQGFSSATPAERGVDSADSVRLRRTEEQKNRRTDTRAERSTEPPSAPRPAIAPWALASSRLLIELLGPVPGARIPRGAEGRWAREMEALAREAPELAAAPDPGEHIQGAIRWALGTDNLGREFEVVVRSGKSLREKWSKLRAAAQRAERKAPINEADLTAHLMKMQ